MSNQRYSMEPPPLSLPVQLLYVTCARSDKDWHSMEHSHYFAELFFITKGEGSFIIDNKRVPVRENDLVLVNPGVSHTELVNKKSPWEYIAQGIEGQQFHSGEESGPYARSFWSCSFCILPGIPARTFWQRRPRKPPENAVLWSSISMNTTLRRSPWNP